MAANLKKVQGGITKRLEQMIVRGKEKKAFLERVVYPSYIRAQKQRWMSEGAADGVGRLKAWVPLNEKYRVMKLRRFAAYPGRGTKMLIATNRLFQGVVGSGPGHFKAVTEDRIVIGVDIPYAKFVNAKRPFMVFSDKFMHSLKKKYGQYLMGKRGSMK